MTPRTPARLAPLACLALLAAACSPKFDGPEEVKGLRLLALQAEPPELGAAGDGSGAAWPADAAALRALVGHPGFAQDGAARALVLHLACTPEPGDASGTACTQLSELSRPADLLPLLSTADACADPGRGTAGAVTFSGLESCSRAGCGPVSVPLDPAAPSTAVELPSPRYALPAGWGLGALPAGHTQRVLGTDVVDLALVVEAAPEELAPAAAVADSCAALGAALERLAALWEARDHLAALKWLHVRGPDVPADSPPNRNPSVSGITLAGAALPTPGAAPLAVPADKAQQLLPVLPAPFSALRERYERFDSSGRYLDTRDEEWAYSWFTTAGSLDHAHTHAEDEPNALDPGHGRAVLWLVVRDLRGGMAWTAGGIEAP
jgi:hypothetical protein